MSDLIGRRKETRAQVIDGLRCALVALREEFVRTDLQAVRQKVTVLEDIYESLTELIDACGPSERQVRARLE